MKIRTFIAADLTPDIKVKIKNLQKEFISRGVSASWVNPESVHLTLAFLGAIEESVVEDLAQPLLLVGKEVAKIECNVVGLGCFPSPKRARVIWIGLEGENEEGGASLLGQLQGKVARVVEQNGINLEERPFKPHLTIARVKKHNEMNARLIREFLEKYRVTLFGQFDVNEFYLYKSDLRRTGAIYTKLKTFALTGQ